MEEKGLDSVQIILKDSFHNALIKWYNHVKLHDTTAALLYRNMLEELPKSERDWMLFRLFDVKHLLQNHHIAQAKSLIKSICVQELNGKYLFYYCLFQSDIFLLEGEHKKAICTLEKAENYVAAVEEDETAELHYKLGTNFHYLGITPLAKLHFEQAFRIFSKDNTSLVRKSHALMGMGLTSLNGGEEKDAEKYLLFAAKIVEKLEHKQSLASVYHNLGALFLHQNRTADALFYLKKVSQFADPSLLIANDYLLTETYMKQGNHQKAYQSFEHGFQLCKQENSQDYLWRFAMLVKKFDDPEGFRVLVEPSMSQLHGARHEHATERFRHLLTAYFTENEQFDQAVKIQLATC
jgi:tetratricopeptide (TPR) repeat protein